MTEPFTQPPLQETTNEFPSYFVLKEAHGSLVEQERDIEMGKLNRNEPAETAIPSGDRETDAFLDDVEDFMCRAADTGRILEDENERSSVLTLLNYWATVLFRAGRQPPSRALHKCEKEYAFDLDESQCPYLGLEAFTEENAHLFFGRRDLIKQWVETLSRIRLFLVFGPSGCGKTSLVQAGLVPALRDGGVPGSGEWRYLPSFSPQTHPLHALVKAFAPAKDAAEWERRLRHRPESVLELAGARPVLMVVNHLQEAFLRCDPTERDPFLRVLRALVCGPEPQHRVILLTRLDIASRITQWAEDEFDTQCDQVFVPPLESRDLRAAIEAPANPIGLRFDPGLVDTLVNEFLGEPAALALLQFSLLALWKARDRNRITWAGYRAIGSTQHAVQVAADAAYRSPHSPLGSIDRILTRVLFLRLVQPDLEAGFFCSALPIPALEAAAARGLKEFRDARAKRRIPPALAAASTSEEASAQARQPFSQVCKARLRRLMASLRPAQSADTMIAPELAKEARERVAKIVGQFVAAGLLRVKGDPPELVEIRHESLIHKWPKFMEWWEDERFKLRRRKVVAGAAKQWRESGRPNDLLWRGEQLREGLAVSAELSPDEQEFLDRSSVARLRRKRLQWMAVGMIIAALAVACLRERGRAVHSNRQLTEMDQQRAEWLLEAGDPAGSTLFFEEALKTDPDSHRGLHRLQIAASAGQLPQLSALLYDPQMTVADFSPQMKMLATGGPEGVRLWKFPIHPKAERPDAFGGSKDTNWVAFAPSGKLLVTGSGPRGSRTGAVWVWNLDGTPASNPFPTGGAVSYAVFNPAGGDEILVIHDRDGRKNGRVLVWNFRTGITSQLDPDLPINSASFSTDGELIAVAAGEPLDGQEGQALIWPWKKNGPRLELRHEGPVHYVEFSPDGTALVSASGAQNSDFGAARIWSIRGGSELGQPQSVTAPLSHSGAVTRARFSPDGRWIATASHDGTVGLWDIKTQEQVLKLQHAANLCDVSFSPDGRYLLTGSRDRLARLWEVATGALAMPALNHTETVNRVEFSANGRYALTVSRHFARLWDTVLHQPAAPELKGGPTLPGAAVSRYGQRVLTVNEAPLGRTVNVADAVSGEELFSISSNGTRAALSPDGTWVAIATPPLSAASRGSIMLWPVSPLHTLPHIPQPGAYLEDAPDPVQSMIFSEDGRQLCAISRNSQKKPRIVKVWDTARGLLLRDLSQEDHDVTQAVFSPRGTFLALACGESGSNVAEARIYRLKDNKAPPLNLTHAEPITAIAFDRDERRVLTGSVDDNVKLWRIDSGKAEPERHFKRSTDDTTTHTADVTRVLFNPAGTEALTASKDQTAVLWEVPGGKVKTVLHHRGVVEHIAFSSDGKLIATASAEPRIQLWAATDGHLVTLLKPGNDVLETGFGWRDEGIYAITQNFATRIPFTGSREVRAESPGTVDKLALDSTQFYRRRIKPLTWQFTPLNSKLIPLNSASLDERASERVTQRCAAAARVVAARALPPRTGHWFFGPLDDLRVGLGLGEADPPRQLASLSATELFEQSQKLRAPRTPTDKSGFHLTATAVCEATEQWFAAKWHLDQLLKPDPDRIQYLLRRARVEAKLADASAHTGEMRQASIRDYLRCVELGAGDGEVLAELGRAFADAKDFDKAVVRFERAAWILPGDSWIRIRLGEALAAAGRSTDALKTLEAATKINNTMNEQLAARSRLAIMHWRIGTEEGSEKYRAICEELLEEFQDKPAAGSRVAWPCVMTKVFEDPAKSATMEKILALAQAAVQQEPSNYLRLNTLGAALYRSRKYSDAIKRLNEAREAYQADRAARLAQSYDRVIRTPVEPRSLGRPQDWVFIAMAEFGRGNSPAAEAALKTARDLTSEPASRGSSTLQRRSWNGIEVQILLKEAAELIEQGPPEAP